MIAVAVWELMIVIFWFFLCLWGFRVAVLALIGAGVKSGLSKKVSTIKQKFDLEDDGG